MLKNEIDKNIVSAMKNKDSSRVNSLRFLKSLLLENSKALKPREEIDVILSYKKTLDKSLEIYASHPEELSKIRYDIAVAEEYLPKQMAEEEVRSAILQLKLDKGLEDFSSLMKESMLLLKGKVDGKIVTSLVKQILL